MVILFEAFVRDESLADRLPPESWVLLAEIKKYVEDRLRPLESSINQEEAREMEDKPCCTLIHFPKGLVFHNYSLALREKMKSCFDNADRDIELIWLKFDEKTKSFFSPN
jgi:hypothetical protein